MLILFSICRVLEFWFSNQNSIYENFEPKKYIKFLGEISNNWPKDLLETNVYKSLEFRW